MKPTYWRCLNNACQFFIVRCKQNQWKNKKNLDGARWLIAKGHIVKGSDSWMKLRCPHCDYNILVNADIPEEVDKPQESVINLFKSLKRPSSANPT